MKIYRKSIIDSPTNLKNSVPLPVFVTNPKIVADVEIIVLSNQSFVVARDILVKFLEKLCPQSFQKMEWTACELI